MRAFIYLLTVISLCSLAACTSFTTGTISGGAYINFESGKSEVLRGADVILCKPEIKTDLENDYSFKKLIEREGGYVGYDTLDKATSSFTSTVLLNKVQATKADIDGKYQLEQVKAGSYCLVSMAQVGKQTAFWAVPVTVSARQNVRVDIDNSNMLASGRY